VAFRRGDVSSKGGRTLILHKPARQGYRCCSRAILYIQNRGQSPSVSNLELVQSFDKARGGQDRQSMLLEREWRSTYMSLP
jgi:hypothetical protein